MQRVDLFPRYVCARSPDEKCVRLHAHTLMMGCDRQPQIIQPYITCRRSQQHNNIQVHVIQAEADGRANKHTCMHVCVCVCVCVYVDVTDMFTTTRPLSNSARAYLDRYQRAKAKKPPPVAEGDAADGKKRIEGDEAGPSGEMRDLPDGYKDLVMSALDSIGDHFMQPPQILELVKSYATDETFHSVKVTSLEKLLTHLAEENVVYRVKRKGYSLVQKHKEPPVDAGLDADDLGNDAKKPRIEDDGLNVNGDIANHHCYPVDDAAKAAAEADSIFVQGEPMGLMGDDDGSARPPKKR